MSLSEKWAVIGLDAGGTKTFAALVSPEGELLDTARGGPGNYQAVGRDFARESYRQVLQPLVAEAARRELRVAAVGYGLSGLDRPQDRAALDGVVEAVHPAGAARVMVNDTFLILRAGTRDGVGVAVVSGTGPNTVGWGPSGQEQRIGGLASEFGDFGGGSDIGLEALRAARRGEDGRGPATTLLPRIKSFLGLRELTDLADWMLPDSGRHFSPSVLAPIVFAAALDVDPVALSILRAAGQELGLCARLVAERLFRPEDAFPVVMGGSVLQRGEHPVLRDEILGAVQSRFPKAYGHVLRAQPVAGGALLALDRVAGRRGGEALGAGLPGWPDAGAQSRLGAALSVEDIILT